MRVLGRIKGVAKGVDSDATVIPALKNGAEVLFSKNARYQPLGYWPLKTGAGPFRPTRLVISNEVFENRNGRWVWALWPAAPHIGHI